MRSPRLAFCFATASTFVTLPAPNAGAESVARFADAPAAPREDATSSGPSNPPSPSSPPARSSEHRGEPLAAEGVEGAGPPRSGSEQLSDRAARFAEAGRITEAIGAYTESIRLDPSNGAALLRLGQIRARLGEAQEAEMLFSTAARYRDVASNALTERAHLRRRLGREAEAISDLERAVNLGPDDTVRAEELSAWYVAHRAWLPALAVWRRMAASADRDELTRRATLQVKALSLLAANLDVVHAGTSIDRSWTRRALARLAHATP